MKTPVVDFHAHLGHWGQYWAKDDPDLYLRCMDNAGIDVACLNCIIHGDANRGNDLVAEYARERPDRFVGAAFVTPLYPDEIVPEQKRCFDELGMKFIKVYPHYVRVALDDPLYFPVYEFANQRRLVILSHAADYFDPPTLSIYDRYEGLVSRFPNVTWVMAHSGNGRSVSGSRGIVARADHEDGPGLSQHLSGDLRLGTAHRWHRVSRQGAPGGPDPFRDQHASAGRPAVGQGPRERDLRRREEAGVGWQRHSPAGPGAVRGACGLGPQGPTGVLAQA
jgi:hypothetical protein